MKDSIFQKVREMNGLERKIGGRGVERGRERWVPWMHESSTEDTYSSSGQDRGHVAQVAQGILRQARVGNGGTVERTGRREDRGGVGRESQIRVKKCTTLALGLRLFYWYRPIDWQRPTMIHLLQDYPGIWCVGHMLWRSSQGQRQQHFTSQHTAFNAALGAEPVAAQMPCTAAKRKIIVLPVSSVTSHDSTTPPVSPPPLAAPALLNVNSPDVFDRGGKHNFVATASSMLCKALWVMVGTPASTNRWA